jgi:hypothetical protein
LTGDEGEIKQIIHMNISESLRGFLFKYQDKLGNVSSDDYITGTTSISLRRVVVSKFAASVFHGTEHDNRTLFLNANIPLLSASTSMMLLPTVV